ncbi:MAG: Hpt domain-containing protein [Campylobacterales bacterium]|nr:Hpt domain-containing protein [Campylobacterales bacterium]
MNPLIKKAVVYLTDQIDEETAYMLVEEAKTTFPKIYDKYNTSLTEGDLKQAKEDIHALKGVMGAIGLMEEVEIIIAIEKILLTKKLTDDFGSLDNQLNKVIEVFRTN